MRTEIEARELVVWAPQESLAEAKSLFALYSPKFQTVPCNEMTAFAKATVSVLYLSNPEQDTTVENALVALRHCRVSKLLVYTPCDSSDFAFRVGTMVGRRKFSAFSRQAVNIGSISSILAMLSILERQLPGSCPNLQLVLSRIGLDNAVLVTWPHRRLRFPLNSLNPRWIVAAGSPLTPNRRRPALSRQVA